MKRLALLLVLLAWTTDAMAEKLITSLSSHRVRITSNFVGTDIVLFGTIEREAGVPAYTGPYDIVTIVRGPRRVILARRKERVLGLWVNVDSRAFIEVPALLYVLSNRPLVDLANAELRDRLQLGLAETILTQRVGADFADTVVSDPFRVAFLRLKEQQGQYREMAQGVTFLTPTVFRATIPLPANVTPGTFEVDVRVFGSEQVLARDISSFEITKVGFEELVASSARDHALAYGLFAAALALMVGWAGAIIFRKD